MFRSLVLVLSLVVAQEGSPSVPVEFRGLWCISQWNGTSQRYGQQLGQVFVYNNETFTTNFLANRLSTWINHFVSVSIIGNNRTYQIFINTIQGPPEYVNMTSCLWRRLLPNGDLSWGRQANGTCTPTFEEETSSMATRHTRNRGNCRLFDDEGSLEELTTTNWESELLSFDQRLLGEKREAIVFFGSSSIRLWSTLSEDFSSLPSGVINRGFGGSTLQQCWKQFKRIVLPLEPSVLIVYAGEDDIAAGVSPTAVQTYFRSLISTVRRFYPSLPVAYITIKPSISRLEQLSLMNESNRLIEDDIRTMNNVAFIDIFQEMLNADQKPRPELFVADQLNMNAQGYAIWTRAVNNYLRTQGLLSHASQGTQISLMIVAISLLFQCL